MHTNCLGPCFALQYVCVPANYEGIHLRNHARSICRLLYLCCRVLSWSEVSGCLHSYCSILFTGGDSRVLAGHSIAGSLGDGGFPSPVSFCSPRLEPALLSSSTLSHLLSEDISRQRLFQAEAPTLLTSWADQKPRGYHEPELFILQAGESLPGVALINPPAWWSVGRVSKSRYGSSDGRQKMLV